MENPLELFPIEHSTARVRWRVDKHHARFRSNVRLDHRGREGETAILVGVNEHCLCAGIVDNVVIGHPVGNRDDHFVSRIQQSLGESENQVLAADANDTLRRGIGGAEIGRMAFADRLLQLLRAACRRVLREIIIQCAYGGLLDVVRSRKVRLARAEIDDIYTFTAQTVGFGGDLHGGRNSNQSDAIGERESGGGHGQAGAP